MNRSLLLAMVGALASFNLMAALPEPVDGVVTISSPTELSASDQATLNELTEIRVTLQGSSSAPTIFAKSGETVTIPCPIDFSYNGTTYVGKQGGTLIFASTVTHPAGKTLDVFGDVRLTDGSSFGAAFLLETGDNNVNTIASLDTVFPTGTAAASFQTRGKTSFKFGADNVFANFGTAPFFVLGKNSNPAGILDLNGHDQTIGKMSFFYGGEANLAQHNDMHYITSENAATLTVREGFVVKTGDSDIFNGRLLGGVSFKLDANTGVASFSNTVLKSEAQYSTTTGALICARGTIKLLDGCRFTQLSEIRKENVGNFEISSGVLGNSVVAKFAGTGKVTLNVDLTVLRAQVWNGEDWEYLAAGPYDRASLGDHLDGTGTLYVTKGAPDDGKVKIFTWTGAVSEDLTADGNWEGGKAPTFDTGKDYLVFPTTGRASASVSGTIKVNGFSISAAGGFEFKAGDRASVEVGTGGLALADTMAQTNVIRIVPNLYFAEAANIACAVGDGTGVEFAGALSSFAIPGMEQYAVTFAGDGVYRFAGDNGGFLHRLVLTNATAVTACHSNSFGRSGFELVNERMVVLPTFEGIDGITAPISLNLPFVSSETTRTWIPAAQTPFTFGGKLTVRGQIWEDKDGGKYQMAPGYFVLGIPGDIAFEGGLDLGSMRRLQFQIDNSAKVRVAGDVVRGTFRSNYSADVAPVEVRFYCSSYSSKLGTDEAPVAELACRFVNGAEIYAPQVTVRLDSDQEILAAKSYMPFVNSRAQDRTPCLGVMDLNGCDLSIRGFTDALPGNVENGLSTYPNACYYVRSSSPATLTLDGQASTIFAKAPWRFEGQAGLLLGSDWVTVNSRGEITGSGICFMTNAHSTTTGNLTVKGGLLRFGAGAGWAGESTVSVSGTGAIQVDPGAWGFSSDRDGRKRHSMVTLSFPEEGKGRLVLNENCQVGELIVNGVEQMPGFYSKNTLSPYLEGEGTLHVCGKHPGAMVIIR